MANQHRFPWKWYLKDLPNIKQNNLKVFSCFSCGGGSSMGYKLAGYTVLGNIEIDPKISQVYKKNLNPKYSFINDIRDFIKIDDSKLPEDLFCLDILDGSPPCTTFSMAGQREKTWGKEKKFAEGQKLQTLDDLFFVFLDLVDKLKPKVVIAENVSGIVYGTAKIYTYQIVEKFKKLNYSVQVFLLNAETMGVPQQRKRIFFIARRNDLNLPKLTLKFNEKPILFGEVRSQVGIPVGSNTLTKKLLNKRIITDKSLADIKERLGLNRSMFSQMLLKDNKVACCIVASRRLFRYCDATYLSKQDIVNISTFPQDYNFCNSSVLFICGMSVPPVMMANIATEVKQQFFKIQ